MLKIESYKNAAEIMCGENNCLKVDIKNYYFRFKIWLLLFKMKKL